LLRAFHGLHFSPFSQNFRFFYGTFTSPHLTSPIFGLFHHVVESRRIFPFFSFLTFEKQLLRMLALPLVFPALFCFFLCLSSNYLFAKVEGCNDWSIEICEAPYQNVPNDGACVDECHRVCYYVYLARVGSQNSGDDFPFIFRRLNMTGTLTVTSSDFSTVASRLSSVDVRKSTLCSPSYPGLNVPGDPNSPLLSYEPISRTFAYEVSSADLNAPIISWVVQGRTLLYVLAVDIFPGETVTPNGISAEIILDNGNNGTVVCPNVTVIEGCGGNYSKSVPNPSKCLPPPLIRISDFVSSPVPGFPNRKEAKVWLQSSTPVAMNADALDLLLRIDVPSQGMQVPMVLPGILNATNLTLYSATGGYRIYAKRRDNFQFTAGPSIDPTNTLFTIALNGPNLESECLTTVTSFTGYRRIVGGSFACCNLTAGGAQETSWNGSSCISDYCPSVTLSVKRSETPSLACQQLNLDLWVSSTQNTNLTDFKYVFEIEKSEAHTYQSWIPGTPAVNCPNCVSVTAIDLSPSLMRVECTIGPLPSPNNTIKVGPNLSQDLPVKLLTLVFNSPTGCFQGITFKDATVIPDGTVDRCVTSTSTDILPNFITDDYCVGRVSISVEDEEGDPIRYWDYYLNAKNGSVSCNYHGYSEEASTSVCACYLPNQEQNVAIRRDDDPLNGVTTYDLVLISRHILGLEPIISPFRWLASDTDLSGITSSFDIIEGRKLILGIYQNFPYPTSWRMIDKDRKADLINAVQSGQSPFPLIHTSSCGMSMPGCGALTHTLNPQLPIIGHNYFADEEFEEFMEPAGTLDGNVAFVGFKVGDVSGNAIPGLQGVVDDRQSRSLSLGVAPPLANAEGLLEIPVIVLDSSHWLSWQMALQYDTARVQVRGIRWALPLDPAKGQDQAWYSPAPGQLRLLGFDASGTRSLPAGQPLFYIQVEARQALANAADWFSIDEQHIPAEVYDLGRQAYTPHLVPATQAQVQESVTLLSEEPKAHYALSVYPNPARAHFRIEISATAEAIIPVRIVDLLGRLVHSHAVSVTGGGSVLRSRDLPALPPGQYTIIADVPTGRLVQRLIIR
jgi:hypothetical protein